jgi:hypothetical protein
VDSSLVIGADNGSSTRTNAGNKSGRLQMLKNARYAIALCDVTSTGAYLANYQLSGGSAATNDRNCC